MEIRPYDISSLAVSAAFPLLQAVTLGYSELISTPYTLFGDAPRLNDLRLSGGTLGAFTLPWLQLTKFEGKIPDFTLFTLASNLTEMTCLLEAGLRSEEWKATTHRSLERFTVSKGSHDALLKYLSLPALEHLDISGIRDVSMVKEFFVRSLVPFPCRSLSVSQRFILSVSKMWMPPSTSRH
ncbi:hypothetical protein C8R45DRAFT_956670 [Mycena sanguinolenta]|nr:hypothetical protein C8R45DRAFT_956670 [Mycena sanguinolenta]